MIQYFKNLWGRFVAFIKSLFQKSAKKTTEVAKKTLGYIPGGPMFLACTAMNVLGIIYGTGILYTAVAIGFALALAFAFLFMGSSSKVKTLFLKILSRGAWYMDLIIIYILAIYGLILGATMGAVFFFLGINLAGLVSLVRWSARLKKAEDGCVKPSFSDTHFPTFKAWGRKIKGVWNKPSPELCTM